MSVTKRPNGAWRARILGPDGKERARHFPARAAAKRWEAEQLAARDRGQFVDPSNKVTSGEYAMQWLAGRPYRSTSAERVESMLRNHLTATSVGQHRLVSVRPSEVQAWITERSLFLSPGTLRLLLRLLKAIYNSAVLDRLVATSPCYASPCPPTNRTRSSR
jgi:hypothetical protein